MAVPESIVKAYADYLGGMDDSKKARRAMDKLLGLSRDTDRERCQDAFMAALHAAVEDFTASEPGEDETEEAARYILSQAHEHKKSGDAYWMLLSSHAYALPLVERLPASRAAALRAWFEGEYPKRERMPVQKAVLDALKARENKS